MGTYIDHTIISWKTRVGKWVRIQGLTVLAEEVVLADEIFVNQAKVLPNKKVSKSIPDEGTIIL